MKRTKLASVVALTVVMGIVSVASADMFQTQAGGWRITASSADVPQGAAVDLTVVVDSVNAEDGFMVIEIVKVFAGEIGPYSTMPSVFVNFDQIDEAVTPIQKIILNDEVVLNDTDFDWYDYHMVVDGVGGGTFGDASINVAETESSGFSVNPFVLHGPMTEHRIDLIGGPVAQGEFFYPGRNNGFLSIDVDLAQDEKTHWFIKQWPTPEPATMAVLGFGGLTMLLRRKRQ